MINATALVIGSDPQKKLQLVQSLSETQLFERVKPIKTPTALFQHLKNKPVDIICWAMENTEPKTEWIGKLQRHDLWNDLPLIAFADNQQSLINGFNLGASDSINLSTDTHELNARLQGHLKRWHRLLDLHQSREQLQKMALTDALTGLGNRATFDMSIKQATAQIQRSETTLSLLMIDLDYFKQFNDCYGHQAGDEVLKQVAIAIDHSARESDICCRYGGEEFAVILPDTNAANAEVLANRIHNQIARASRKLRLNRMPITVSIGISSTNRHRTTHPTTLIEEADRALYQAKEKGRNRTETWRATTIRPMPLERPYSAAQQLAFGT